MLDRRLKKFLKLLYRRKIKTHHECGEFLGYETIAVGSNVEIKKCYSRRLQNLLELEYVCYAYQKRYDGRTDHLDGEVLLITPKGEEYLEQERRDMILFVSAIVTAVATAGTFFLTIFLH